MLKTFREMEIESKSFEQHLRIIDVVHLKNPEDIKEVTREVEN